MIFTSYHPLSTLDEGASRVDDNLFNTVEFAQLWYLYVRHYQPRDEHIVIVDQYSAFGIAALTSVIPEPWEVIEGYRINPEVKVHIKRFDTKTDKLGGVKRLYLWLYEFCWHNRTDMWFIENDCLVAKEMIVSCRDFDFVTNYLHLRDRVCDTYLCKISAARLVEHDCVYGLLDWVAHLRQCDTYRGTEWVKDPVVMAVCERGIYARFCYGNVGVLGGDCVIHDGSRAQLKAYLAAHPINHPLYEIFMRRLEIQ